MRTSYFAIFLILLLMSAAAFSQDTQVRPETTHRNPLGALNLTKEQAAAIQRINREKRPRETAARKRFNAAREALDAAIYDAEPDENAFKAKLDEFNAARAELANVRFWGEFELRKMLTAEQLAKFREMRLRTLQRRERRQRRPAVPARTSSAN